MALLSKPYNLYYPLLLLLFMANTMGYAQAIPGTPINNKGTPALRNETLNNQSGFDSLIKLYGAKQHKPLLFVHFDKTVYSNNDNVWFTAYVLNNVDSINYTALSLTLVNDNDHSVVLEDRFVIDMNFSFGNTVIPDSVPAGSYSFIAYGNKLHNKLPDVIFTQPVSIRTESTPTFTASLNPLDTASASATKKVMLLVNFIDKKSPPTAVPVRYYIGKADHPVFSGTAKTVAGQYIFAIPKNVLSAGNNRLHVQVKYDKEVQDISMDLPLPIQPLKVRFYPEGGNIVTDMPNVIGWEVKSTDGSPVSVDGVLFEDTHPIDTIQTNGNGLGRFLLIPKKDKDSFVATYTNNKKDTLYQLPKAITASPSLFVRRALANDTLSVEIRNNTTGHKLYLIGHNFTQTFFEVPVANSPLQRMKILLKDVPRGLGRLTLVDSLGHPFAERTFFAHYDQSHRLKIATNSQQYKTRQKVTVSVDLPEGLDNAVVSIACVQENRVEIKNKLDIESYYYLKDKLGDLPLKENYFGNGEADKRDMENVLLIKGWSRYKWTDVLKVKVTDTLRKLQDIVLGGTVSRYSGKMKKPVSLIVFKAFSIVETDEKGNYTLNDNQIITENGKKVSLMVSNDDPVSFQIKLNNPYDSLNKQLAALLNPVAYYKTDRQSTSLLKVPANEHSIRLKEVVITDKKDESFYAASNLGANACGDYVCMYNILNCPNHRTAANNRAPVTGNRYQYGPGGGIIVYAGCKIDDRPNALTFKGIYSAQEFYPSDYSEINPSTPEYLSTLYWNHLLPLKKGIKKEFSFYTSDITGRFKIIIQGITDDAVVYSESGFTVIKAQK